MSAQHVVQFENYVYLTRLPPGRAEGRIWVPFVLAGLGSNHSKNDPGQVRWNLRDHVEVTGDHGTLERIGLSGSDDGRLNYMTLEMRDDGSNQITVEYRQDDQRLSSEVIDLPVHGHSQ